TRATRFSDLGRVTSLKGPTQAACTGEFGNQIFIWMLAKKAANLGRDSLAEINDGKQKGFIVGKMLTTGEHADFAATVFKGVVVDFPHVADDSVPQTLTYLHPTPAQPIL